jgi:hypothetical protein
MHVVYLTFEATGKGNILITLPNGQLLKDMLYAPKMGLTLVLISCLTATGYAALFHENSCKILYDRKKKQLAEIPVSKGLYCVKAPRAPFAGLANAKELLSMQDIHMRLAHMAPDTIQKMIHDGTITGMSLDPSNSIMEACDSCEYAKATWKAIGKVRDPPRCEYFGNKVHSNLWGPSPVKTPGH